MEKEWPNLPHFRKIKKKKKKVRSYFIVFITRKPGCKQEVCYTLLLLVQSLSHVRLFVTLWTAAHQDSPSFTISQSLLKLMFIELGMPSNHVVLCHSLLGKLKWGQNWTNRSGAWGRIEELDYAQSKGENKMMSKFWGWMWNIKAYKIERRLPRD